MGEVKTGNDSFIFGFVIGGLEPESEGIFHVNPIRRGHNQPCTASLSIGGPIYGQPLNGEDGYELGDLCRLYRGEFHDEICQICPLIAILCLYLMSNSLSSMAHFTSLLEVSGLCNICFIGCSVGISMV